MGDSPENLPETENRWVYIHPEKETDIARPIRRKIGQYVGNKSVKSKDKYSLDNDGEIVDIKHVTADGKVAPLQVFDGTHIGGAKSYAEEVAKTSQGQKAVVYLNKQSNTGYLENIEIIKGKADGGTSTEAMTFEELMEDNNSGHSKVGQAVDQKLQRTTGYTPEHTWGQTGYQDSVKIQRTKGSYDFQGVQKISIKDYETIALRMMLEASGEPYIPKDFSNSKETAKMLSAQQAGVARLGARVPYTKFRTENALQKVEKNYPLRGLTKAEQDGPAKISYGNPYNPYIVFEGLSDPASIAASAAMMTALIGVIYSVAHTTEAGRNFADRHRDNNPLPRRRANLGKASNNIHQLASPIQNRTILNATSVEQYIGFTRTRNDFSDCVRRGVQHFFGTGYTTGTIGNALHLGIIGKSPGYASVILRNFIRDTMDIFGTTVFGNLIPLATMERGSQEPHNQAGTVSNVPMTIEASASFLTQLRDSRLLKFINTLAIIGDNLIDSNVSNNPSMDSDNDVPNLPLTEVQDIESGNITLKNLRKRHRFQTPVGSRLTMAGNAIPSLYMESSAFMNAKTLLKGAVDTSAYDAKMKTQAKKADSSLRLDKTLVKKMEKVLDSSYVPFYFHDLRTNEIISFHAFLEEVEDSFASDIESVKSYGRVGQIGVWKNTTRKVDVTFMIVAMDQSDFDEMWFKINRMVTMMLPQYSEGRQLSYRDGNEVQQFIQPFSQIPVGSPVVRMRIGDMITNNKSLLDVGRLFGVGGSWFGNSQTIVTTQANDQVTLREAARLARPLSLEDIQVGQTFKLTNVMRGMKNRPSRRGQLANRSNYSELLPQNGIAIANDRNSNTYQAGRLVRIENNLGNNHYVVQVLPGASSAESPGEKHILDLSNGPSLLNLSRRDEELERAQSMRNQSQQSQNLSASLQLTQNTKKWIEETPIMRAFDNSDGEGMLCMIESFRPRFDVARTAWEIDPGSRAPIMAEIQISVLPMFDINPGLAADGTMIGAPYRVGKINHALKGMEYPSDAANLPSTQTAAGTPQTQGPNSVTPGG